jgi:hypothetical protein
MQLVADDLLCPSCGGYVHVFLERCPACGTPHAGRFGEAVARGPLGAGALLDDEATRQAARAIVMRYSLRSRTPESTDDLPAAFDVVARSLRYRASVAADGPTPALPSGPPTLDDATLRLVGGALLVRAGPSGRVIATLPLDGILAATPIVKGVPTAESWAGAVLGERQVLPQRLLPGGDLLLTFSGAGAAGQLSLANRRGLLAQTARPDHYVTLARWIGILGAAAAEVRCLAVSPAAYAAELGLGEPAAGRTGSVPGPVPPADTGTEATRERPPAAPTGVRAALEELEALRSADLVSAEEYEAKRREILARL